MRIENIGDLFDYPDNASVTDTTAYVDLQQLAKDIYYKANPSSYLLNGINIHETQMTGITSQNDMQKGRYQWKGVDDA